MLTKSNIKNKQILGMTNSVTRNHTKKKEKEKKEPILRITYPFIYGNRIYH